MIDTRTNMTDRVLTLDEFYRLPEEDAFKIELVRGRVVREPRPGAAHGWLSGRLVGAIEAFVRARDLGITVTETGFLIAVDPPTIRGPDAAFIAKGKLPRGGVSLSDPWTVAPDLAIEVLSPSNRAAEIQEKILEYMAYGTRLVWVVDPRNRCVTVYRSGGSARLVDESATLDGEDVLPGFAYSLADLFAPIARA